MQPRLRAPGRRLAVPAVAACLMTNGVAAVAAAAPADAPSARAASVTIATAGGRERIRLGDRVRLAGRVAGAGAGLPVRLEHAPGGRGWRPVRSVWTGADGGYRFEVRALRSGAYRAAAEGGAVSTARRVTVAGQLTGRATRHLRAGARVRVRGVVRPGLRRRLVRVQLLTRRGWRTVARARTSAGGRFRASWRPPASGVYRLRLRFAGDRLNASATRGLRRGVHVYRPGRASWFGPGLYGNRTGCGQTLTGSILGVAHKHLPCGTRVVFRYRGRSVVARVIDRGPFAGGREWDLTSATKRRLGFGDIGVVWTTR